MRQFISFLFCVLIYGLLGAPVAGAADQMTPAPKAGPALAQLFVRPVVLRGTLDGAQIQMELHLKQNEKEAFEGSYFLIGQNRRILLAGEFEEDALMMEESSNGKDVSGLWDGVYDGVTLNGTWSSLDDAVKHSFLLKIAPTGQ